jgi:hypothetical protein
MSVPEPQGRRGRLWHAAAWLTGLAILLSIVFFIHSLATSWALGLLEHHAGDPLWVYLALIGSALLVLAGPAILLAGLFAVRRSWVAGGVLLLGGGFLTTGLMHLYPSHAMALHNSIWGEIAEAFGLLLAIVVVLFGFIDAWRNRHSTHR